MPRDPDTYPDISDGFSRLPKLRLETMLADGQDAVECIRVRAKTGDNIVGELLKGHDTFFEWDHYPPPGAMFTII